MIIVEPIAIGDVACRRASPKWVYDRTGTLVEVPANVLGVTYNPADLTAAPYAKVEAEATNYVRNNTMQGAAVGSPGAVPTYWGMEGGNVNGLIRDILAVSVESGIEYIDVRYSGIASVTGIHQVGFDVVTAVPAAPGEIWAASLFLSSIGQVQGVTLARLQISERNASGAQISVGTLVLNLDQKPLNESEISLVHPMGDGVSFVSHKLVFSYTAGTYVDFTVRIGLPRIEYNRVTSPIKTVNGAVTRAADVISAGAGLVYSNVPIVEPPYDVKASYGKDALVHDPATYELFQSLIAGNLGKALSDTGAWSPRGVVNRRAMFDEYNNTQTSREDEIIVVLTPEMIAQGLYLGNLDVDEVRVSTVDAVDGLVYSDAADLVESNSKSSYFNWMFKRIKRRTYFLTLELPVYANALVTVCLRKIGGIAKCGMCAIGPIDDFGPSLLGLSTEGKDFSSTTFNFDGTSKTTIRPYAKRMSCEVVVPNDEITYVGDRLFELRQRPLVWVGGPYGITAVFGRYGSFKNVIPYQMESRMSLTIEGAV